MWLQVSDWVLKQFPEVEHILSKAGRAENPNRSRAAVYAGDRNHPEAEIGVASRRLLVFVMGA